MSSNRIQQDQHALQPQRQERLCATCVNSDVERKRAHRVLLDIEHTILFTYLFDLYEQQHTHTLSVQRTRETLSAHGVIALTMGWSFRYWRWVMSGNIWCSI